MNNPAISTVGRPAGWQLVTELAAAGLPGSHGLLLGQVMATVQGLNLQPPQLERIHEAFGQVLARAMPSGEPAFLSRLGVRIWVLGSSANERGWSFFLVEKLGNTAPVNRVFLVELFLYQEQDPQM
jgi:hypothetical protein